MGKFRIRILATGGTLAKRYEAHSGQLAIDNHVVDELVACLSTPDIDMRVEHVLARDSLDMTSAERADIAATVQARAPAVDAIVITHGTDTLTDTAAALAKRMPRPPVPVVFTGAMVPHCCAGSDARDNVAQAVAVSRLLSPGIHIAFHGRVLDGLHAAKDYDTLTFVPSGDAHAL